MSDHWTGLILRFTVASDGFAERLRMVRPEQLLLPTPCTGWNVRQLVNHVAQANLNYMRLLDGGTAEEFVRMRDADALGDDPLGAFMASAGACADKRTLATGHEDGTVRLYDLAEYRLTNTLYAHKGPVWGIDFHPTDERRFITASDDGTVKLWDLTNPLDPKSKDIFTSTSGVRFRNLAPFGIIASLPPMPIGMIGTPVFEAT